MTFWKVDFWFLARFIVYKCNLGFYKHVTETRRATLTATPCLNKIRNIDSYYLLSKMWGEERETERDRERVK